MVLFWVYRMFVETQLHKPPFCSHKYNKSFCGEQFDEMNHLERPTDFSKQRKKAPRFQKKRVFYFSPAFFTKDEPCTIDSMYKFYLKSLDENYSMDKSKAKYPSEIKTKEDKTEASSFHYEIYNVQERIPAAKNSAVLRKELKKDFENQVSSSRLNSKTLDIFHYYSIFPLYVSKMIFDNHNSGYYYVKYLETSDLNTKHTYTFDSDTKFPDKDIYSVDDQTFENFCLQEAAENIEESPRNVFIKSKEPATEDEQVNEYYDQKCNLLKSEMYEPYCNLKSEKIDSMGTFDLWQSHCVDDESEAYYKEKIFKDVGIHKPKDSDNVDYDRKLHSAFLQDKCNFSLAKMFRNLLILNRKKVTNQTAASNSD